MPRGASRAGRHLGAPRAVALLLALLVFTLPTAARAEAGPCEGEGSTPNGHNDALIDNATLCLMNEIRTAHGLPLLHHNSPLRRIATGQAHDMVRGHYFGDQSLSGQSPLSRIMASAYVSHSATLRVHAAQNIGWGTGHAATPAGIVRAWMESPPHRAIILTAAYRDAGVGAAPSAPSSFSGPYHAATYAAEFGIRSR